MSDNGSLELFSKFRLVAVMQATNNAGNSQMVVPTCF